MAELTDLQRLEIAARRTRHMCAPASQSELLHFVEIDECADFFHNNDHTKLSKAAVESNSSCKDFSGKVAVTFRGKALPFRWHRLETLAAMGRAWRSVTGLLCSLEKCLEAHCLEPKDSSHATCPSYDVEYSPASTKATVGYIRSARCISRDATFPEASPSLKK